MFPRDMRMRMRMEGPAVIIISGSRMVVSDDRGLLVTSAPADGDPARAAIINWAVNLFGWRLAACLACKVPTA